MDIKTDEELVLMTLDDQRCYAHLIKRYEGKLIAYIRKISAVSYEEAEDLLQDIFIKVYYNLNGFDTSLKFSSWIYRITYNHVISQYRKKKTRKEDVQISLDDDIIHTIASDFKTDAMIDEKMLKESLFNVLNAMDKKYSDVLILKFLEEKSYKEISDIIQKPMGTIATLINRAKKQFLKELSNQNIEL